MKKLLGALTILLICIGAFAQGKILFTTDSLHLVYWDPSWGPPLGGQAADSNQLPLGHPPLADLYMGTSSSSLYLYSSTTFGSVPGKWNPLSVSANANASSGAPAIPGGTSVFVVAQIRDGNVPAENIWTPGYYPAGGLFYGISQEFTFTLGSSITYPPMYNSPTWAPGTFPLDSSAGVGARGAIAIPYIPEPSAIALATFASLIILPARCRRARERSLRGEEMTL